MKTDKQGLKRYTYIKEMAGEIGLTNAGQYLDDILTKNKPAYKVRLVKFIHAFTITLKRVRPVINQCSNMNDKYLISNLLKKEYMMRFNNTFKEIVDELTYSLVRNYIHTLTRPNFIPTTTTQLDLIRKKNQSSV